MANEFNKQNFEDILKRIYKADEPKVGRPVVKTDSNKSSQSKEPLLSVDTKEFLFKHDSAEEYRTPKSSPSEDIVEIYETKLTQTTLTTSASTQNTIVLENKTIEDSQSQNKS